tara:strand:+ start:592 stop:1185 length:594 start_codon:yes stop_codon:yes gene_type:complete
MSFRIEKKLYIKPENLFDFKKFLNEKKIQKLHQSRYVKSLYFENKSNQLYLDSVEGILPRKKIRIRNYPNTENLNYYLEYKYSTVEGRFKENKEIPVDKKNYFIENGIFDKKYGLCRPKLEVMYQRNYFKKNDVRITIDTNIAYNLYSNNKILKDKNIAVELKTSIQKDTDDLFGDFPFKEIRFSKYCNGIELFKKN